MFILKLYDRKHNELKIGDIVKISNGREFTFFAEVKYLESEKVITPFHTFSFHSFEKVDKVPEGAKQSSETRYKIWWIDNPESDMEAKDFEHYLTDWRSCERSMEKGVFSIEPMKNNANKL